MIKWVYIIEKNIWGDDVVQERGRRLFISEILSRALDICKDSAIEILKTIGIFIAPAIIIPIIIITALIMTVVLGSMYRYSNFELLIGAVGIGSIILIIFTAIISGVISLFGGLVIVKVLDDANKGNEISWKKAAKHIWERKWSLLGLNILVSIMMSASFMVLFIIGIVLSLITFGIGAFVVIPAIIAIVFLCIPMSSLFNSVSIVRGLGITDAIRETFLLFKKQYFLETIARTAAIAGIYLGAVISLSILEFIPFIGSISLILGQFILMIYLYAYLNVFVLDRMNSSSGDILGIDDNNSEDSFIDPII